jgi:hypothetical protein
MIRSERHISPDHLDPSMGFVKSFFMVVKEFVGLDLDRPFSLGDLDVADLDVLGFRTRGP